VPIRKVRSIDETHVHAGMNAVHRVRQVLEPGQWREHDPFLMLAEDWFVPGTFGDHPHRGFETVTYVIDGAVEHRDNHGGHGVLRPGDAQWMTAGRGVVHSEEAGAGGAHSLQLWVNLPSKLKMSEPRYQDLRGDEVPVRVEPGAMLRVYSGKSGGFTAPTRNLLAVTMVELRLDAGAEVRQELPDGDNCFVYLLEGAARFGDDERPARAGQVVWFERDRGDAVIRADETTRAFLWSGPPIGEPVAQHGPFVMNTREELLQAFHDFQSGKF
jgi:redox-sensitive bicupin YhaK (pirin superfamily)